MSLRQRTCRTTKVNPSFRLVLIHIIPIKVIVEEVEEEAVEEAEGEGEEEEEAEEGEGEGDIGLPVEEVVGEA